MYWTRSKMSTTVAQETHLDHQDTLVNKPLSPRIQKPRQYIRQKTFQGPKKSLEQSGKPAQCRDTAELRTTQRQELLCYQNTRENASTKSLKVLNTTLSLAQNLDINQIKSSARECASSHLVLPDPSQPPADQDNTSLWIAVMSQKKKDSQKKRAVNSRGQAPTTIAPSAGARGTSNYENFLIKLLGNELKDCPHYSAGPDDHFPLESRHPPIEKHVQMFEGMEAMNFANAMKAFPDSNPNESRLCHFITMYIFFAPISLWPVPQTNGRSQMTFDQKAIVQITEHTSIFYDYSVSEIRSGLADIRHVRLSPKERLEGCSIANTPNLLPAAADLRGRCDMAFGVNHMCLHARSRNVKTYLPCYDPSAGVCCIWLRAEFKKKAEPKYIKAALHQWAAGAYLDLSSRVRLARDENRESFLSDPESTKDLRQYGYIICGEHVEIWEMCVTKHQDLRLGGKRRDTDYFESYFKFPTKNLVALELDDCDEVTQFCQWHAKIMDWGFNVYSREYLENVDRLRRSKLPPQEWALSYEDAVGKPLPSLPEEETESCKL